MSGFATRFAISRFSARSPHVPSIAEHRSTILTFAPVSSMSCLLFGPDLLRAVVARGLPEDRAVRRAVELGVERRLAVAREQVLGGVEGVVGDEPGVVGAEEVGVLLLSTYAHVGWGTTMSLPSRTCGASTRDVVLRVLAELVDVAGVEPRHAAAHLALGQLARDAVAFVDADERLADRRVLVLDEARGEERDGGARARPTGALPGDRGTTSRTAPRRTSGAAAPWRCR